MLLRSKFWIVALFLLSACSQVNKDVPLSVKSQPVATQDVVDKKQQRKIGLMLPLTGANAAVGESLLNAAQMALFDLDKNQSPQLIIRDTEGRPEKARVIAHEFLKTGVRFIVGPVFASEVEAVKSVVQNYDVLVLSFSTNPEAASKNVYLMGFVVSDQLKRIFAFASKRGLRNIGVLVPASPFGMLITNLLKQQKYENIRFVEHYTSAQDVAHIAAKMKGQALDGLYIPEGGDNLERLILALEEAGVNLDGVRLLGSAQWDFNAKKPTKATMGAWVPLLPSAHHVTFATHYKILFASEPHRLASLSFDAIHLLGDVKNFDATRGHNGLNLSLATLHGFQGIDGAFRFFENGMIERVYDVVEIGAQGVSILESAPQSFTK